MHQVILDRLEQYLSGSPVLQEFTAHLESCEECRTEVHEIRELSGIFATLREPEPVAPPAGFIARVLERVEAQRPRSVFSMLWLDPLFGRRFAFASLMTLVILGSYLVTRETDYSSGPPNPETIMARQVPADSNPDMILATLASYEEP